MNFNPLSPCGERQISPLMSGQNWQFQSTLPMRGETIILLFAAIIRAFQSTLPMRGETPREKVAHIIKGISIHSPHAGRDTGRPDDYTIYIDFNPLSPCGERHIQTGKLIATREFQSTLPMRGETASLLLGGRYTADFNPLSPCGERRRYCS